MRRDAVNSWEVFQRIHVPDYLPVRCTVRAQVSVHRSGKNDAWNNRDRSDLRSAASRVTQARGAGWRGVPNLFARGDSQSEKSASGFGLRFLKVGERKVDRKFVGGATPLDSAEQATAADTSLPDNFPLPVRIKRVDHTRFLPYDDQRMAAR